MKAKVGDKIVVMGHRVNDPRREAEIIGIEGENGEPPYRVRWDDDGHEGVFFPGADASVSPRQ